MYFLSALLIYVPIGILCHFHLFKALNITDGVFQGLPKYVWAIIIEYSSASILYIIFAWIYYKVKHIELFLSFITSFLYRISTTGLPTSKVDAYQPLKWMHSLATMLLMVEMMPMLWCLNQMMHFSLNVILYFCRNNKIVEYLYSFD